MVYGVAEDGRELDVVAASRQARPHMYMYGYMTSSYVYVWVYDVVAASRQARSEVLLLACLDEFAKIPAGDRELTAAACRFKVDICCFDLAAGDPAAAPGGGDRPPTVYRPKEGVVSRATLVLGRVGDVFWSLAPPPASPADGGDGSAASSSSAAKASPALHPGQKYMRSLEQGRENARHLQRGSPRLPVARPASGAGVDPLTGGRYLSHSIHSIRPAC